MHLSVQAMTDHVTDDNGDEVLGDIEDQLLGHIREGEFNGFDVDWKDNAPRVKMYYVLHPKTVPTVFAKGRGGAPVLSPSKKKWQVPRSLLSGMFGVVEKPRSGGSAKFVVAGIGRYQLFVVWLQRRSWWGFLFSMGGVSQNGMKDKVSSVFLRCCVCSCISFLVVWRM
jgi:hypothetical protein